MQKCLSRPTGQVEARSYNKGIQNTGTLQSIFSSLYLQKRLVAYKPGKCTSGTDPTKNPLFNGFNRNLKRRKTHFDSRWCKTAESIYANDCKFLIEQRRGRKVTAHRVKWSFRHASMESDVTVFVQPCVPCIILLTGEQVARPFGMELPEQRPSVVIHMEFHSIVRRAQIYRSMYSTLRKTWYIYVVSRKSRWK